MNPTRLDSIIKDSRSRLGRLRSQFPDPQDFDYYVKRTIRETLRDGGYTEKTIRTTMYAIFGEQEKSHGKVARG